MGLSKNHIMLVNKLKQFVEERFGSERQIIIYTDNPDSTLVDRVPKIGGSIPDLYARCYNPDLIIIGEAKTVNDVETRHSIMQYEHFLLFCSQYSNIRLIFAVPWTAVACLKNTIAYLKRRLEIFNVDPLYIELLPE